MTDEDRARAFLAEIEAVCRKHRLSLSHEDGHGGFEVHALSESNIAWVNQATVQIRTNAGGDQ